MDLQIKPFTVHKRFALTISRGTSRQSTNLWLILEQDGIAGWGEATPFSVDHPPQTTEQLQTVLQDLVPVLKPFHPWQRQEIEQVLHQWQVPSAARSAIDLALYDWMGKCVGIPLWQLWGLDRSSIAPLSVTIGIGTPETATQRLLDWLTVIDAKWIKVKLGNPAGIEADRAMFQALQTVAPVGSRFLVDANGGWSLGGAIEMSYWLAEHGVEYLEQPLVKGQEEDLLTLKQATSLPIFVDESCWTSQDIPKLVDRVDGINIKLLKAGGLTEALRMVQTARALGLKVMFGCYSESILLNTAAAQLSPLADYLDLDSHLNLLDDPFVGATIYNGCLVPNDRPGLGVSLKDR